MARAVTSLRCRVSVRRHLSLVPDARRRRASRAHRADVLASPQSKSDKDNSNEQQCNGKPPQPRVVSLIHQDDERRHKCDREDDRQERLRRMVTEQTICFVSRRHLAHHRSITDEEQSTLPILQPPRRPMLGRGGADDALVTSGRGGTSERGAYSLNECASSRSEAGPTDHGTPQKIPSPRWQSFRQPALRTATTRK